MTEHEIEHHHHRSRSTFPILAINPRSNLLGSIANCNFEIRKECHCTHCLHKRQKLRDLFSAPVFLHHMLLSKLPNFPKIPTSNELDSIVGCKTCFQPLVLNMSFHHMPLSPQAHGISFENPHHKKLNKIPSYSIAPMSNGQDSNVRCMT